jgi:EAL domain-containing protein (putative c-di-GMP-specific phosphodiesterase class I)
MKPERAQAILQEIVRISHSHGVSVLAEGVENAPQHEALMAADVDMFQGYLFGAPVRLPRILTATTATASHA